ncbi:hypothetical protein GYMLUDRAFT_643642 [Collybiopsis luxurians FD-317 M1]|nr:hypothetical protein GYMLUDRAFT_643642 [Collybiopsis luxurians FD-317 M1]
MEICARLWHWGGTSRRIESCPASKHPGMTRSVGEERPYWHPPESSHLRGLHKLPILSQTWIRRKINPIIHSNF